MTCSQCGGTGFRLSIDSHGVSFGIGVDPCVCSPDVTPPIDFADLVAAAVFAEIVRLTGGQSEIGRLRVENATLRADLYGTTQALHDIRGLLGFDNDGDKTPGAQIAGAKSVKRYTEQVIADVKEHRHDDNERNQKDQNEIDELREDLRKQIGVEALRDDWRDFGDATIYIDDAAADLTQALDGAS